FTAGADGTTRFGEQVTGPLFSLWEDALDPRTFALPFDPEGTPKKRVTLVDNRVAGALGREPLRGLPVVHDRQSAKWFATESTGHAVVDERHPLLRRAFGIERQREGARVERVLPEGEERTGDLFAEARCAVGAGRE